MRSVVVDRDEEGLNDGLVGPSGCCAPLVRSIVVGNGGIRRRRPCGVGEAGPALLRPVVPSRAAHRGVHRGEGALPGPAHGRLPPPPPLPRLLRQGTCIVSSPPAGEVVVDDAAHRYAVYLVVRYTCRAATRRCCWTAAGPS